MRPERIQPKVRAKLPELYAGARRAARALPQARLRARLFLCALVVGCAAFQPAPTESPVLHVLDARSPVAAAAERRNVVLEVSAARAWPGYDSQRMAYVRKPHVLDYYAANRWADAPSRMLAPLLVNALEQTGSFRAIVQSPAPITADVRVGTELVRLHQDFTVQPSRVELALHVQLVDVRGRRVLATRTFQVVEPAASDDAYGGVTAANRALARVLGEVAAFCVEETGKVRAPPGAAQ